MSRRTSAALAGALALAFAAPAAAQADDTPYTSADCPDPVTAPPPAATTGADNHPLTLLDRVIAALHGGHDTSGVDFSRPDAPGGYGNTAIPPSPPTSTGERPEDDDVSC